MREISLGTTFHSPDTLYVHLHMLQPKAGWNMEYVYKPHDNVICQ